MPVFVDPKTGERFDAVPDEEAERAQKEFGLVSEGEYAARQRYEQLSPLEKAGDVAAAGLQGIARASMAPGMAIESAITGKPAISPRHPDSAFEESVFSPEAIERKERHPLTAGVGEAVPSMLAGGALGGAVAGAQIGLAPALGGLVGESALSGVSQEAVDSVTQKRDFSAKAALLNGGVDLALSALTFGAAHGLSRGGARAGAETAAEAADGLPGPRNMLAELDPGEVPEAIGGGRRARSAGSAGAANAPYRAPPSPRRAAPGEVAGEAANDLEPFADDVYDAAAKSIDDAGGGKGLDKEARFLADPQTARNLTDLGAMNVADQLDNVRKVLRDDVSLAAKNEDFARMAAEWTPEQVSAQKQWLDDTLEAETGGLVSHIDDSRAAAADVRTGASGRVAPEAPATLDELLETYGDDVAERAKAGVDIRQATREKLIADGKVGAKVGSKDWRAAEADVVQSRFQARRPKAPAPEVKPGAPRSGADAYDAGGFDTSIQKSIRTGMDRVRRAEGAERVVALDSFKRDIGKLVGDVRKSRTLDDATKAERTGKLTSLYATLREGLEDEAKFGRVGTLQRATNEPLSRLIEPLSRIEGKLSERLGDTFGETGQKAINRETKAAAVAQMLRAKPVERREFIRTLDEGLSAIDEVMEARQAHGITHLDDLKAARRGLEEMRSEFKFSALLQIAERRAGEATPGWGAMAAEAAVDFAGNRIPIAGGMMAKQGKTFLRNLANSAEMPKAGTPLGDALGQRLKAYARNPDLADAGISRTLPQWLQESLRGKGGQVAAVGGLVGAGALLAPGQAGAAEMLPEQRQARDELGAQLATLSPEEQAVQIRTAEAFARIGQRVDSRVKGAVTDLFALARDPKAPPRHRSPQARQLDQRAAELDVPRHVARFMGKEDDPVKAWEGKAKLINDVVADPSKLARAMADNLGDLPRQQPEIFAKMVGQTMATVQYLHERMPGMAGRSALDPEGYPPTFEEITEWAGHWVGAIHPLDSMDDLASNDLVPEQMEAVQSLWPEGYAMFQTAAMAQIHALSQKPSVIPQQALEQIDAALDLDGAGESTLSSAFKGLLEQATAKEAEAKKAQGQQAPPPMQSQGPSRLASSALGSLHPQ